ncbi:hypothetical protein OG21DRAFT_301501 [Imleria badia]|nr:hypothetical protein OG21DRAFT_301501 [Imleria badia]
MLKNINAMDRSAEYANSVPLIQSSGTGKSRMVDEQAKLVFTIPFNLHPQGLVEEADLPQDTAVWEYLCTTSEVMGVGHGMVRATLFFRSLFSEVATEVNHAFFGQEEKLSPGELACRWKEHLSSDLHRYRLYKRVIEACNEIASGGVPDQILEEPNTKPAELLAALDRFCIFPNPDDVKVMLYFDKAHELYHAIRGDKQGKTLYNVVCSSLNHFKNYPIFTIFISTELPPTQSNAREDAKVLQAPITETAFDCHPSFPIKPGQLKLKELGELPFLARFGRPLFWTMLNNKEHVSSKLLINMMNLARMKLLFNRDISELKDTQTYEEILPILDVLITIDYEPRLESAHQLQMEMVASHMRTMFSVPVHGSYAFSGYPSKPFIAEAASRQMHHYTTTRFGFTMAMVLKWNLDRGLIDVGQKGEMVMRILLRKAYMDAITAEQGDTSPNFSQGCSFLCLLKALFADPFHNTILDCKPDNLTSNCTLESAFEHAVVRFTHFVKATDSSATTTRSMLMGFLRGSAIVVGRNHIAIPILLHKDYDIEEASMSTFLVQVKPRDHLRTVNAYFIDAETLGCFPRDSVDDTRPYVTLVAELAGRAPPPFNSNVATGMSAMHGSAPIALECLEGHPRYSIRAHGCTDQAWKVIRSTSMSLRATPIS